MPKKQSPAGGQVRPAEPRDLARVLDIWYEANCQAHAFVPAAYWQEKRPLVAQLLPEAQLLVWEEAGQAAGFLACRRITWRGSSSSRGSREGASAAGCCSGPWSCGTA